MKRGYLGIDESNNGRFPEIFVAVYSEDKGDIKKQSTNIEKIRGSNASLESIAKESEFRYILIPKDINRMFFSRYIKTIVFSEFIRFYKNLEVVIIDGEVRPSIIMDTQKALKNITDIQIPKIIAEPKGDEHYKIVNRADFIANFLMRKYYSPRSKKRRERIHEHLEFIITPKIEDYLMLFPKKE